MNARDDGVIKKAQPDALVAGHIYYYHTSCTI
jgi:hypothetical protein